MGTGVPSTVPGRAGAIERGGEMIDVEADMRASLLGAIMINDRKLPYLCKNYRQDTVMTINCQGISIDSQQF